MWFGIHVNHGKHPFTKYPVTQGHEVSGKIVEVAEDVEHLKVGQKVTIEPQLYVVNVIRAVQENITSVRN